MVDFILYLLKNMSLRKIKKSKKGSYMIKKKLNFLFLATIFSTQLSSGLFAMNPDLSEKEIPPSHVKQNSQDFVEKSVVCGLAVAIASKTVERNVGELCESKWCDSKSFSGDVVQGLAAVTSK
jgi:hypothetical protein